MPKLGFGEILLAILILFLVAPKEIPKILRKIGELWGSLRKLRNQFREYTEEIGISEPSREGGDSKSPPLKSPGEELGQPADQNSVPGHGGPDTRPREIGQDQSDSRERLKLLLLDIIDAKFDFSQTRQLLPMLFDESESVRDFAKAVLSKDPAFRFPKKTVSNSLPGTLLFKENSYIEFLFAHNRLRALPRSIEKMPRQSIQRGIPVLAQLPGFANMEPEKVFTGEKSDLVAEYHRLQEKANDSGMNRPIRFRVSETGGILGQDDPDIPHGEADQEITPGEFGAILERLGAGKQEIHVLFSHDACLRNPGFDAFIREMERLNVSFIITTSGLNQAIHFSTAVSSPRLDSVIVPVSRNMFRDDTQRAEFLTSMHAILSRKIQFSYRYTIDESWSEGWDFLDPFISIAPMIVFQLSIQIPSSLASEPEKRLYRLIDFREPLISLIEYISSIAAGRDFQIIITDQYPLCALSREDLLILMNRSVNFPFCGIGKYSDGANLFERCGQCLLRN